MLALSNSTYRTVPAGLVLSNNGVVRLRGLGDSLAIAQQGISAGGSIAGGLISSGAIWATAPAWAVPAIGAAVVAAAVLINVIRNSGCGQTCIVTTDYANRIEGALHQNIDAYFSGPRTRASQIAALNTFDAAWQTLAGACGQPALGDAGKRCVTDRQAGACVWKQTADSSLLAYPGEPGPGACWNWFSGYRDPIANDPGVVDSPVSDQVIAALGPGVGSVVESIGGSGVALALVAVFLGVALS